MLQYPCVHNNLQNMKKFVSEIFKCTILGKLDAEEASHIEVCVNPNIQEKNNLTHKTSSVGYADMLLPLTKIFGVKINAIISAIGTVGKYEVITCSISNRWYVL